MSCQNPITVFRGKEGFRYSRDASKFGAKAFSFPCGQCRSCRVKRRLDWAVRLVCEARSFEKASVLTLTYRTADLPLDGGLRPDDLKGALKRLRSLIEYHHGIRVRFFAVGEYGEFGPGHHPHFHVILFGFDFSDRVRLPGRFTKRGTPLYYSPMLEKAWGKGFVYVDPEFSWEAASYVSQYVMKKINGERSEEHYKGLEREFIRASTKPGIGHDWLVENRVRMYSDGFIDVAGKQRFIPRKFDQWTREEAPELWAMVLEERARLRELESFEPECE